MYILYYVPFPGPKKICEFSSNFKNVLLFSSSLKNCIQPVNGHRLYVRWNVEILVCKISATK